MGTGQTLFKLTSFNYEPLDYIHFCSYAINAISILYLLSKEIALIRFIDHITLWVARHARR